MVILYWFIVLLLTFTVVILANLFTVGVTFIATAIFDPSRTASGQTITAQSRLWSQILGLGIWNKELEAFFTAVFVR